MRKILRNLGPGLLFAGAAVGVSHLVQSTRAGAAYGFELIWIILIVNIFKYPFFEIGQRYTSAMNESLIRGYERLGKWAVWLFLVLNVFASVLTIAAVTFVASAIFNYLVFLFLGLTFTSEITSIFYMVVVVAILYFGKYNLFENFVKYLVLSLSVLTVLSVLVSVFIGTNISPDFIPPQILNQAGIGFLLALMGWMPAPLELSSWTSLWSIENDINSGRKKDFVDSLLDFNIGYIACILLAVCFLALGAFVMYGTGEEFSNSAVAFTGQLLSLYTSTIGNWSKSIIAFIMFVTMFSTVITCLDAYPRSLAEAMKIIKGLGADDRSDKFYWPFLISMTLVSSIIIYFFTSSLTLFVDLVTIIAFLSSPIIATLNFLVIRKPFFPQEYRPKQWLNWLSYFGLVAFFGFALLYIYSLLFMG
ncbi:MAG: divalent metal cation transporter [Ignavibacteriae bacterium]|nr:divalent metal cation transporter [Ignavibacteriota bacterium]MCB9222284.1 divalent metal cation transporter [Ignavibacteria bacterium]